MKNTEAGKRGSIECFEETTVQKQYKVYNHPVEVLDVLHMIRMLFIFDENPPDTGKTPDLVHKN